MTGIPFIGGLSDIADRYDHFILDLFGVVHDGIRPFPGTIHCLEELQRAGKHVCLLSNSPRRAENTAGQCVKMGIPRDLLGHAVTSGEATHAALETHAEKYGPRCYFIGGGIVQSLIEGVMLDFRDTPDDADFILNAIPGVEDADVSSLMDHLDRALARNLPMICANPDLVVNIGTVQRKCAGTYAALYEREGGHVTYYGKPYAPVYDMAWEKLGRPDKSRICAVGDSLHTDIQGANGFGIDSVFNLVGIHWEELALDHAPAKPDSNKIKTIIDSQPHRPTYTMGGFDW